MLWALGWSMITLAALIRLPMWAIVVICVTIVVGHNALDTVKPDALGSLGWLWQVLHVQSLIGSPDGFAVFVGYPLVPWIAVMGLGYAFGALYIRLRDDTARRRRVIAALGLALIAVFVVLRATNLYGDPRPWSLQWTRESTVMSFLNVTKYPPSLSFLCVTLGISLLLLVAFEALRGPVATFFVTFGRVPMFFYLLHLPLLHLAAIATFGRDPGPDTEVSLPIVYVVWIVAVLALYPACRWYAGVKARSKVWWLSYV